ncbi:MAG TPA: SEC-C metal-binding domain-containing protein [Yinghuangia sp.]|nr:SEC-C metal-binding domain-containing protein [Yinghuangia sp.]
MSRKRRRARSSAPSQAVPLSRAEEAAAAAPGLEKLAAEYPDEREELLVDAASAWSEAGEHERAVALYDRLLADEDACDAPDVIRALRVSALWSAGLVDQAREAADALRARHPRDGDVWCLVAEQFEDADELDTASEWFTAGLTHALGPTTPVTADTVLGASHDVSGLVVGRHRVRRKLRVPHDHIDEVAHDVHEAVNRVFGGTPRALDELHDPDRPVAAHVEVLREANARLGEEVAERRANLHVPDTASVLYWPGGEFTEVLRRWPGHAEFYGADSASHIRNVEQLLVAKSEQGESRLAVARGTVAGLIAFAADENADPARTQVHADYAADLTARGRFTLWPPPRNGPCWCGSDRKYKKCCGNAAVR